MSYEFHMPHPQGWQCPVCGRVYSPYYPKCDYCGKSATITWSNTNGTTADVTIGQKYDDDNRYMFGYTLDSEEGGNG